MDKSLYKRRHGTKDITNEKKKKRWLFLKKKNIRNVIEESWLEKKREQHDEE